MRYNRGNIMQNNSTLGYYDNHAAEFYKNTVNVEFAVMQRQYVFSRTGRSR
jgi:hypothetical protein